MQSGPENRTRGTETRGQGAHLLVPLSFIHLNRSCPIGVPSMSITAAARRVARLLQATGCKLVLAESCTGGLVSGALTKIPGISNHHCGGVVVYRNATKQAYLNIPAKLLDDPGPVSAEVAEL